ncbi:sigma-70 family RNA polymerase sigma factor [Jeotgalibacillus sp. S-D1]|uniref:sigma-70 family RNA polymerase sigma factor n=1 Tax=Jeotgalibacillus sp. S-D1 TaxID=2552189 RepID=UPI00105A07E5|nr:sigma-70 family RNA polymerase sigma factor [Jeotgalibacillus sp. S-D1]TDL30360.1 sigma-70 family RNA polymerase sigma factor [Jeotgalibacillus sp. S-D1]
MEINKPVTLPPDENDHRFEKFIEQHLHKITQFLIQTGIERDRVAPIACAILDKYKHDSAYLSRTSSLDIYRKTYLFLQNETAISESKSKAKDRFLSLQEDIELHEAIQQLSLKERAVLALSFFHLQKNDSISKIIQEEPEEILLIQKHGIRSLKELLAEKDQFELSDDQLLTSLEFLRKSYASVPKPSVRTVIGQVREQVPQNESLIKKKRFRWTGIAGTLIVFLIVLIYSFSFINEKESTESSSNAGSSPELSEEKLNELTIEFDEKLALLSSALGLTDEETRSLEFVKQAESQLVHFQSFNQMDESPENKQEVIENFDEYKKHILLELSTPLEMFFSYAELVTEYGEDGSLEKSDFLTQVLHYRLTEVQRIYTEKLNHKQDNTGDLIGLIRENGFEVHYDNQQSAYVVQPGGDVLEETIASLHPVYREYLHTAFSFPYVENNKMTVPYEEVPLTLLKMEDFLKDMSAGEVERMMVYDQLAMEYSQLLNHFIFGSSSEPLFDNGRLKKEVKTVWEKIMDERNPQEYQFAGAVYDQYNLLAQKDFKQAGTVTKQVTTSYTPQWFEQSEEVSGFAIPLEGELSERFTEFQQDNSEETTKDLTATEVVLFYLHAVFIGDANAIYTLMSEEPGLPSRDDFVKETSEALRSSQQNSTITDIFVESSTPEGSIVRILFENGGTRTIELVEQGNGLKIKFDEKNPLQ